MKHIVIVFLMVMSVPVSLYAQIPSVVTGRIIRHADFPSLYVTARHIDVWLPAGYDNDTAAYRVLYMHDGQMLFDSTITWNKQEWGMDEVAGSLIKNKEVEPFIIVGIWNGGITRHVEYFPQKPFEAIPDSLQKELYKSIRQNGAEVFMGQKIMSDAFLKFIVSEVKPFIDQRYRVKADRSNTFIAGSSMGGLISLYAVCEYPEIFGGAACLSTHWPGIFSMNNNPIPEAIRTYLKNHIPSPDTHRFYFDHGTATLDAMYPELQKKVDPLFSEKGYREGNYMSEIFEGANHSEAAWRARIAIPLRFLLDR
jgi:predicted alpha/beta superfamily hydrolase